MPTAIANQAANSTGSTIVAARTGAVIKVYHLTLSANGATATPVTFLSSTTAISPVLVAPANNIAEVEGDGKPLFSTASGEALLATTGAGQTVGISVVYEIVGGTPPVDPRQGPEIDFSDPANSGYLIVI